MTIHKDPKIPPAIQYCQLSDEDKAFLESCNTPITTINTVSKNHHKNVKDMCGALEEIMKKLCNNSIRDRMFFTIIASIHEAHFMQALEEIQEKFKDKPTLQ